MLRLRTRLLLTYSAVLVPLLGAFVLLAVYTSRAALERELQRGLATSAALVAGDLNAGSAAGRIARMEADSFAVRERMVAELESARTAGDLRRLRVITPDLRTLLDTDPFEHDAQAFALSGDQHEIDLVLADREPRGSVMFVGDDGARYMRGYAVLVVDDAVAGLVVAEGSAAFFDTLARSRRWLLLLGLVGMAVFVGVTALVSRRITAPLSALAGVATRVGQGEFDVDLPEAKNDEIGALSAALRRMQRDLAAREEEAQMMLAGIAHEVRNPLGGMELFVGLLEESVPDDESAALTARVRRELDYLSRVVESFLDYARERPLDVAWDTADAFVADVLAALGEAGAATNAVTVQVAPGARVAGDLSALRGVVINLLLNALQACEAGATLVFEERDDASVVTVRDTGCGMPRDVLENAFRPFYTTREKGTGLGLPLARRIVERHGGTIVIDSAPDAGTTVTITLPWRPDAPRRRADATQDATAAHDDDGWDGGGMIG